MYTTNVKNWTQLGLNAINVFDEMQNTELKTVIDTITNKIINLIKEKNVQADDLKTFINNELSEKSYTSYVVDNENYLAIDLIDNINSRDLLDINALVNYIIDTYNSVIMFNTDDIKRIINISKNYTNNEKLYNERVIDLVASHDKEEIKEGLYIVIVMLLDSLDSAINFNSENTMQPVEILSYCYCDEYLFNIDNFLLDEILNNINSKYTLDQSSFDNFILYIFDMQQKNIDIEKPIYMNLATGSVDNYKDWEYIADNGDTVNAVDKKEVKQVIFNLDINNWKTI